MPKPDVVRIVMRTALERTWKHLARERLMGVKPVLPLGKRFWPLSRAESNGIASLVDTRRSPSWPSACAATGRPSTSNCSTPPTG